MLSMLTIHNPFFSYREWSCSELDDGTTSCVVSPEERSLAVQLYHYLDHPKYIDVMQ